MQEADIPATDEKMNIVFVGHVDHGKSTVIGRLLADTGSLPDGKLEQVRQSCIRDNRSFEYAYLIDALKDERAQSITIDSARVFFQSPRRRYIIIDAPGHIEFIKNMVTGASRAEAAVLVIDAEEGVKENSRRHGYLLWMLGIKQIVVVINKMDLVDYDRTVFERIRAEYSQFLAEIGIEPLCYIPVSGRQGDNVASLDGCMTWYEGHTVLSALDSFAKAPSSDENPFRLPVQDVYKFSHMGDSRRIVAGTVASGSIGVGEEVVFYPSGKRSRIKSFEVFSSDRPGVVSSAHAAGFTLEEQIYIRRGEVACRPEEPRPFVSRHLRGSVFWMGKQPLLQKKEYTLKLGTAKVRAQIETIHRVIDASNLETLVKDRIEYHDVAEVTFLLQHPVAFDRPEVSADTSRFVIVDDYEIWGGGIVFESVPDDEDELRDNVFLRQQKWIKGAVSMVERAEHYNQNPALVLITGKQKSGRKRTAAALEKMLFVEGKHTYYLGVGSVLYGLSLDLKREHSKENWHEHLRRIAELAYIFLDAGLILIMTAVELTQDDLKTLRTIIDGNRIETIWVGDEVTTDLAFDLEIPRELTPEDSAVLIKRALQQHGVIFSPWNGNG